MTHDEIQMIQSVIRTSANTDDIVVRSKRGKNWAAGTVLYVSIKNQRSQKYETIEFDNWVPDVPNGADAAALMLQFMFNEECPKRVATFFDYIQMAYEFGKNNRWT